MVDDPKESPPTRNTKKGGSVVQLFRLAVKADLRGPWKASFLHGTDSQTQKQAKAFPTGETNAYRYLPRDLKGLAEAKREDVPVGA